MLLDEGFVTSFTDLYRLDEHREKMSIIEGFGEKSIEKMLDSIEKSKNNEMHQFINGLGISLIGAKAAKVLSAYFGSIDTLIEASLEDLIGIDEIGEKMADSFVTYFKEDNHKIMVSELKTLGLLFTVKSNESASLNGKIFVLTGSLEYYGRKELQTILENAGAKVSSSVSKKTDFVIYGEKAGSKLKKANDLGVKALNEADGLEMLREMSVL
jgi:DNA ligase (NAD+)